MNVHKGRSWCKLPMLVVEGDVPPLLGRNCLADTPVNWDHIKLVGVVNKERERGS